MASHPQTGSSKHFEQKHEKKKFDKRKFWDKKYNLKHRVQEWEEKRQKYIKRKYQKELRKYQVQNKPNTPNVFTEKQIVQNPPEAKEVSERNQNQNPATTGNPSNRERKPKKDPPQGTISIKAAKLELQRRKEAKRKAIEESLKRQQEIKEALEKYKKKKAEKFKKLSKKNKKGQPVMKERLELLLEEIKQKVGSTS